MVVNGLTGIASLMTPYVGLVVGGRDMLAEWVKTAIAGHESLTTKRTIPTDILPGDPQLAAEAVRPMRCSLRERCRTRHGCSTATPCSAHT